MVSQTEVYSAGAAERPWSEMQGRFLNHVEMVYQPGERHLVVKFFELLGCEVRDAGGPWIGIAVDGPGQQDLSNNAWYASEVQPEQLAYQEALAKVQSDAELTAAREQFVARRGVLSKPFGHPIYDPIYRAAAEHDLPIVIHLSGGGRDDTAGGNVATLLEIYPLFTQAAMHHLTSMISYAVFEKFPTVRVMLTEWGFTWLPSVAKRLDAVVNILRAESPLVRRRPSEVIREHVRFSTQPFEYVPARSLASVLEPFHGMEDVLCFSSDYPHWDADDPIRIASRLPKEWHRKVFYENAAKFFGFEQGSTQEPLVASGQGV